MSGSIQRKIFTIQSAMHMHDVGEYLCGQIISFHRICLAGQLLFCSHYTTERVAVARSDISVVPPKQAGTSSSTKPTSSISPKVMSAALSMSPPKTAVTMLKEYCEKMGLPQPQYSEIPQCKEQQFQFKVSLKSVEVSGKVGYSKQQAKQSAAQLAIQKLGL